MYHSRTRVSQDDGKKDKQHYSQRLMHEKTHYIYISKKNLSLIEHTLNQFYSISNIINNNYAGNKIYIYTHTECLINDRKRPSCKTNKLHILKAISSRAKVINNLCYICVIAHFITLFSYSFKYIRLVTD